MEAFWVGLGITAAVIAVLLLLLCGFIFNQLVWRRTIPLPRFLGKIIAGGGVRDDTYENAAAAALAHLKSLPLQEITLTAPDGAHLIARLLVPENPNGKAVLACHGSRSTGLREFRFTAPDLYEKGYVALMPDHRGCGDTDGKYMGYGTHESKDSLLWVQYLEEHFPEMPIFLLGVSLGGATVLMMSDRTEGTAVRGVIADCAYTSAWAEFSYQLHTSFHLPDFPLLHLCDLYCRIFCGYSFRDASPIDAVRRAKVPILFVHGGDDLYVPYYMQGELYDACVTAKEKLTVPGAVHARSFYTAPEAYMAAMERFMEQCLGAKA